jgi:hypothetical protein
MARCRCRIAWATVIGVALAGAPAARAETVLSPDQMKAAAAQSLRVGDPVQAGAFADALLRRDPDDLVALLIKARALRDKGENAAAQNAARAAWDRAQTDDDRYAAALIMAQALASDGKRTRAQFWLRRAAHHAPSERHARKAERDFKYVQQRNPWKTELSFTLAPNSNVNNGSARERSQLNYVISELLFGEPVEYALTGSARALSGVEIGGAVKTRYRMSQTETTAHDLNLSLSYRSFVLSDSARSAAPGVSGSDFAFGSAGMGYDFRRLTHGGNGEMVLGTEAGQSWYGGERYASFLRGSASQSLRLSPRRQLRFGAEIERQNGQNTSDVDRLDLSGGVSTALASGHRLHVGLAATTTRSANADAEYDEIEFRTGLALGRPVMGAALHLGIGAALRDFDVSRHSPDGRNETRIFADVTATFEQVDYYGFNPTVTFSASHTDSNVGLYDTNRFGFGIGVKSAF